MGWQRLPVQVGGLVEAAQMNELRLAIIERRRAVGQQAGGGVGDPPAVAAGTLATAAAVNAYRERIDALIGSYLNVFSVNVAWTKPGVMAAALGPGRTDWTRVPARAGGLVQGALATGDVMYAEHLNDMKEVLDKLYLVAMREKVGRQYCSNGGSGWVWETDTIDPDTTTESRGDGRSGLPPTQKGQSAPFTFTVKPVGTPRVNAVKAKGVLRGVGTDLVAKHIHFTSGSTQPSDRSWKAQMRVSNQRPTNDPRGEDTTVFYENNLADDGSHSSDSKTPPTNTDLLEVFIDDNWPAVTVPAPGPEVWPFWVTWILADHTPVITAYTAEAGNQGRTLMEWYGKAYFAVRTMWAEMDFDYLER